MGTTAYTYTHVYNLHQFPTMLQFFPSLLSDKLLLVFLILMQEYRYYKLKRVDKYRFQMARDISKKDWRISDNENVKILNEGIAI